MKQKQLAQWIELQLQERATGERLPTVREMMKLFGIGQTKVEKVLQPLVENGRIRVRRGEGIVILDPALQAGEGMFEADLLILYRLSDSRIARNALHEVEGRLRNRGVSMLQIGYASEDQAVTMLERTGRYRVCLLQVHFDMLSLRFLAALYAHCDRLVIDGVSVSGIDADGMGTNWREALSFAFHRILSFGHDRIGFLTSSHPAQQIAAARSEYLTLANALTPGAGAMLMEIDKLPGSYRTEDIVAAFRLIADKGGKPPFSSLIVWGVVEGYLLERALAELGWVPGVDLGVVLLGSVDFTSEHRNVFDTVGFSNAERLDLFERVILARIKGETWPARTHYLGVHSQSFGSLAEFTGQVQPGFSEKIYLDTLPVPADGVQVADRTGKHQHARRRHHRSG